MGYLSKSGLQILWTQILNLLKGKVDAVEGKGLSTNDYTNEEKEKLNTIETGAEVNVQSDFSINDSADKSYIKNRTHYEAEPIFDISWDGVIGDRFALDMSVLGLEGIYYVKVSDIELPFEELYGSTIFTNDGYEDLIYPEDCDSYQYNGVYVIKSYVIVVYDQAQINSALGFPDGTITNGVYFYTYPSDNFFTNRFVGKDNTKKLDMKYLPDGYPYELAPKFNIIWDGNMEGRTVMDMTSLGYEGFFFAKVSDDVFSIEEILGAEYAFNDRGSSIIEEYNIDTETWPGVHSVNQELLIVHDQDLINTALGLPEGYLTNGVYFVASPENKSYIARFTSKTEIQPIDKKYLSSLAAVATSGNYYDLSNKPTIYTDVIRYGSYQNLSGYQKITARSNIGVYSMTEVDNKITSIDLSDYYTKTEVDDKIDNVEVDLSDYYTKTEVDDKIDNVFSLNGLSLIDEVNGKKYTLCMRNGVLNTYCIEDVLVDYEYTDNGNGTYTITDWKGTSNGEPSTEIIIPDSSSIVI